MTADYIFLLIILIVAVGFFLDTFLDYLNIRKMAGSIPDELEGIYNAAEYQKSQQYLKEKTRFGFLLSSLSFIVTLFILFVEGFAWLDNLLRTVTEHKLLLPLLYFGVIGLAADILSTPFDIYHTFTIEEKYGFNKTTPRTYIMDKLKGWLLSLVLGGGLLTIIILIYHSTGPYFWLIAWLVMTLFSLFMTLFYSNLIVPLFNKQTPLEEGELRKAIEAFSNKVNFKLKNIFVIDGSKRSSKTNAYFTGFGPKKRIVLYDTLMKNHTIEEIVAILAHEVGHYKKKHVLKGMITGTIYSGLLLYLVSLFLGYPVFSEALGAANGSFHIGIIAFGLLYSPVSMIIGLWTNYLSRKHEFQADRFAAENYSAVYLTDALKKLSKDNLSNLNPHPVYVFFHYSHPPLLQRITALKSLLR